MVGDQSLAAHRQQGKKDERILGSGAFVESILSEAELSKRYRLSNLDRKKWHTNLSRDVVRKAVFPFNR
jgi:hypothetical protein